MEMKIYYRQNYSYFIPYNVNRNKVVLKYIQLGNKGNASTLKIFAGDSDGETRGDGRFEDCGNCSSSVTSANV